MAKCRKCGEEKAQYLENGICYSCRRIHFEQTRPLMLFDFLTDETKKKILG